MRLILLFLCLALACCAPKQTPPEPGPQAAYVTLPANYVIDVAAGASVRLNPAYETFAVYPSKAEAERALISLGLGEAGENWRVFILEGDFQELAKKRGDGYCLDAPARVIDWVE